MVDPILLCCEMIGGDLNDQFYLSSGRLLPVFSVYLTLSLLTSPGDPW